MVEIPKDAFRLKTEMLIEDQEVSDPVRPYFGISGIGASCTRALWYNFRWVSKRTFKPRVKRLLNRGHREEPIVIKDLRAIGCEVKGAQKTMVTGYGHIKGHPDGIVANVPDAPKTDHLLEIKTANNSNFNKIKKVGVEKAQPSYWAQVQCYMSLLKLKRTLFIVVNKDNDERYYERIRYDKEVADGFFKRAEDTILSEFPPPKIGGATWYECKWCDHYQLCQFGDPPQVNCRTCHQLDMHKNGRWRCGLYKKPRSVAAQRAGCGDWTILKGLE
jgi:hypothetical protein